MDEIKAYAMVKQKYFNSFPFSHDSFLGCQIQMTFPFLHPTKTLLKDYYYIRAKNKYIKKLIGFSSKARLCGMEPPFHKHDRSVFDQVRDCVETHGQKRT